VRDTEKVTINYTNKKLYTSFRLVPLLMTLSDPEPQFLGHSIV